MKPLNSTTYGPVLHPFLDPLPLPALGPGKPNEATRSALALVSLEDAFPQLGDRDCALACLSGLWLLHDCLDESHHISQDLNTPTGSYWHAIMHRREPDAANSKYWFRQMGHHPVVALVISEAAEIGYNYKNPEEFVDFCERVRGSGSPEEDLVKHVQLLEWQLLFDWCWNKAK